MNTCINPEQAWLDQVFPKQGDTREGLWSRKQHKPRLTNYLEQRAERLCQLFGKSISELGLSQIENETQVERTPQPASVKQMPSSAVYETGQGLIAEQRFVSSTSEYLEGAW